MTAIVPSQYVSILCYHTLRSIFPLMSHFKWNKNFKRNTKAGVILCLKGIIALNVISCVSAHLIFKMLLHCFNSLSLNRYNIFSCLLAACFSYELFEFTRILCFIYCKELSLYCRYYLQHFLHVCFIVCSV